MAVLQKKLDEVRYMKRQNLEEESKIIGNAMRDIIRQFGIDCNYYKLKTPYLENFKRIVDENSLLMHAYGQDSNPDYSMSSTMLTYMEVENDVFQMNKFGVIPNQEVNFYFDSMDFACALAYKFGQFKEYPIKEQHFEIEVPEQISDYVEYEGEKHYLSDDIFPYGIGYGVPEYYECDILKGKFAVKLQPYEIGKEYVVQCYPYEHNDVAVRIPSNDTIYKSFEHVIDTKEYVKQLLFLKYRVSKILVRGEYKFILRGKLYGTVLFRDLHKIGKYMEMIHPDIGDILTIDFPDENNRQQYEITDCSDKNMSQDGINPLLHKYVWKCKAKRYVNSGEDIPEKNEGDERWKEKIDFIDFADEEITKQVASYDEEDNDAVYGGYERPEEPYDKEKPKKNPSDDLIFIDDGSYIEIFSFRDNSKLITDGYDLYFVDNEKYLHQLTLTEDHTINVNLVANGLQYIKSTDNALFFVNFDDNVQRICEDDDITQGEVEMCLNSLLDTTYSQGTQNKNGDYFYKFTESNTILMSIDGHLYCRFGNKNHKMVKLC